MLNLLDKKEAPHDAVDAFGNRAIGQVLYLFAKDALSRDSFINAVARVQILCIDVVGGVDGRVCCFDADGAMVHAEFSDHQRLVGCEGRLAWAKRHRRIDAHAWHAAIHLNHDIHQSAILGEKVDIRRFFTGNRERQRCSQGLPTGQIAVTNPVLNTSPVFDRERAGATFNHRYFLHRNPLS